MLDNLTQRFARVVKQLRGEARLTEENVAESLREVRMALLEADVALPVVKDFVARAKEKALGEEVIGSLTPGQALVGVVQRELTAVMGGENAGLELAVAPPAVILMAGLQGSGKTTTVGKLAKLLKEEMRKKPLVVSADVYRPAAIEQLATLARQADVDFFPSAVGEKPVDIARAAAAHARSHYNDVLIVDTAGRLAIDEAMMKEIAELHAVLAPTETLFVVDSMGPGRGQRRESVRRGAAHRRRAHEARRRCARRRGARCEASPANRSSSPASARSSTGLSRSASAWRPASSARATSSRSSRRERGSTRPRRARREVQEGQGFDLEDFKGQIQQMKKMGGLASLVDKLPAQIAQAAASSPQLADDRALRRIEGIINSMTPAERAKPEIIKASRKRRIAAGAGVPVQEVNRLLNQFGEMQKMMKSMQKGGLAKMMRAMKGAFPGMR
jgi:signal recognition particle subunit SRP54